MALFATPKKETKKPTMRKASGSNKYTVARAVHAAKSGTKRLIPSATNSAFIEEWAAKMKSNNNSFVLD